MRMNPFDDLTDIYEAMIDWPRRLAREGPFFRRWFEQAAVGSVLEAACGTGHHAAMFHGWRLRVEGADISPRMIDRARASFGEADGLHWVIRSFDTAAGPAGSFDAAVCVGNSLALATDMAVAAEAVRQMFAAVRPGGLVIIQVLNLWRLPDGPCIWQKCVARTLPQGDCPNFRKAPIGYPVPFSPSENRDSPRAKMGLSPLSGAPQEMLILKGVHRAGTRGYVDLVVADPAGGPPLASQSVPWLGLEAVELEAIARQCGAATVQIFGGYQDEPYDRPQSVDLVMVCRR
jgi:SAM-dependent methyltransferase